MEENLNEYQYMIDAVPSCQQESLRRRIVWALKEGWNNIGLWTGEESPDETDLVGVYKGKFGFVPLVIE